MAEMFPRGLLRALMKAKRSALSCGLAALVGIAIVAAAMLASPRDRVLLAYLLLLLLVGLVAWSRGWKMGLLVGAGAAAMMAPFPPFSSIFRAAGDTLALTPEVWVALGACYMLAGVLLGARGASYQELERTKEELAVLCAMAASTSHTADVSRVQANTFAQIAVLLQPDVIQLYEASRDGSEFVLQCAQPPSAELAARVRVSAPADEGIFKQVVASEHVEALSETGGNLRLKPPSLGREIKSIIAVPLLSRSRVAGVLILGRKQDLLFSERDEQVLQSVGQALIMAVENAKMFSQFEEESYTDELTGLGNRRMFNLRLAMEMDGARKSDRSLCLVIFDLDHFKQVNDRRGHLGGDEALRQFARRVKDQVRETDLFCRIGGEEFALVAPSAPLENALAIAERIRASVAQTPLALPDGSALKQTVSAGVAVFGVTHESADDFIADADAALYKAKAEGRNRVAVSPGQPMPAAHAADEVG